MSEERLVRSQRFERAAQALGYDFGGEIVIGGHYVSLIQHGDIVEISGQIPRVGSEVLVTGRVGVDVDLAQAQTAAKICLMRALALLNRHLNGLDAVAHILRLNVYVQSAADFTQQSEVADGASDLLYEIFGEQGVHTRTSVGVYQLPKNAAVELDLRVAVRQTNLATTAI